MTGLTPSMLVMAGLVPATQMRRPIRVDRGGEARTFGQTSVLLGGRDKPGHDVRLGRKAP